MKLYIFLYLAGMLLFLANAGPFQQILSGCKKIMDVTTHCKNEAVCCFGFSQVSTNPRVPDTCNNAKDFPQKDCDAFVSVKRLKENKWEIILVGLIAKRANYTNNPNPDGWVGIAFSKDATIMSAGAAAIICTNHNIYKFNLNGPGMLTATTLDQISDVATDTNTDGPQLICKFTLTSGKDIDLTNEKEGYYIGISGNKNSGYNKTTKPPESPFQKHDYNGKSKKKLDFWKDLKVGPETKFDNAGSRQVVGPTLVISGLLMLWYTAF